MKVRVKFSKQGNMKFIGHLDVMRYFQKAIRRAGIDIAYTEGLSPHMIMSFASPLGVGLTSDGEYMDIELRTPISSGEAIDALNRVGVEGMEVTGFYEIPEGKANKAMTLVAAADYVVRFRKGYEPDRLPRRTQDVRKPLSHGTSDAETHGISDAEAASESKQNSSEINGDASVDKQRRNPAEVWINLASAVEKFYAQKEILVWKKTKKSEKEVDIRPMIYEMRWIEDGARIVSDGAQAGSNAAQTGSNSVQTCLNAVQVSSNSAQADPNVVQTGSNSEQTGLGDASHAERHTGNPGAVFLRLASGSEANLKPELVMDTLLGMYGIEVPPFAYEINRCELYADTGNGDVRSLTPLCALGREIV